MTMVDEARPKYASTAIPPWASDKITSARSEWRVQAAYEYPRSPQFDFYVLATGCQWSALPKDLAPKDTAHDCFIMLDRSVALRRIHQALYIAAREQAGKEASPTAAIIESPSAKTTQKKALDWTRKAM
jgi:transposase